MKILQYWLDIYISIKYIYIETRMIIINFDYNNDRKLRPPPYDNREKNNF